MLNSKIKSNLENLPKDLSFINSLDISILRKKIKEKYMQIFPQTPFQASLKKKVFDVKIRDFLKEYGLKEEVLFIVYEKLEQKAQENGIIIEYLNLSSFIEDEYYGNEFSDEEHEKHAETARSDGKTLILEKNLEKAGGIPGRMYDLLHLAFGHMVQWSAVDINAFLSKEEAWSIGYRNHEKSSDLVLDLIALYEFEAGMMGVNALMGILENMPQISPEEKMGLIQYFTDYVYADSKFIIQHYRGNKNKFEKYFFAGQDIPPIYKPLFVPVYIKRHAVEIGLIKDKQD